MKTNKIKQSRIDANRIFTTLILFFVLLGNLAAQKPQQSPAAPTLVNLVVTYLDCGQGDAIVIRTPTGKTYLIDAGPNEREHGGSFDAGTDVIVPFLQSRKTKTIAGIVISHPHLDHYGGALSVMENFSVRELIDSGWPTKSPPYLRVLKKVEKDGIAYRVVKEGDKLNWDPYLKVEVFGPRVEPYEANPEKENPNNRSIVIKLIYKKIAFLFSGDAELEAEDHLANSFGSKLESQILKAPHHGSRTSSSDEFLSAVNPEAVIISCGRRNRFGHPAPSTLDRYKQRGLKYYRTDQDGTVQVISDGNRYTIKAFAVGQTPGRDP